jgi:DNA-binding NarL/FixJ family response regulator
VIAEWQAPFRSCCVLVADEQPPLREGMRVLLESAGHRVLQAANADEAVALAQQERPDVCVLDLAMPGGGRGASGRISASLPETAIVAFTASDDEASVVAALGAGASGYLVKGRDDDALVDAVEIVARGFSAMPPRYLRLLTGRSTQDYSVGGEVVRLTRREGEIFRHVEAGRRTAEIARLLGLSPITVRRHISGVVRKLNAADRAEALEIVSAAGRRAPRLPMASGSVQ